MKIKKFFRKVVRFLRGNSYPSVENLRAKGAVIGENCDIYGSVDPGHEFLVSMGDRVSLASGARILTHDGSTKKIVGYSRVGRVDIGSDVFIGANAIILPNTKIGSRVIVGAGCVVTKDIPDNSVVVGNPGRIIGSYEDFVRKTESQMETAPVWKTHFLQKTPEEKQDMRTRLQENGIGFDI